MTKEIEETVIKCNKELGVHRKRITKLFKIHRPIVNSILTHYKENGTIRTKKYAPKKESKIFNLEQLAKIRQFVDENKTTKCNLNTIKKFANSLTNNEKAISNGGMEKIIKKRLRLRYKSAVKKLLQNESNFPKEQRKTSSFILAKLCENNALIISIDETHLATRDVKKKCWARKGEPNQINFKFCDERYSLCLAICQDKAISAQILLGTYNQFVYYFFIEKTIDILKKNNLFKEGCTYFLMDNCSSHKAPLIQQLNKLCGARIIYNAAYTPELNPIENIFGVLKTEIKQYEWRKGLKFF